ncbi:MAG: 50S ribosomal protein L32 [Candidatus Walczuchella monophlebidarum]
MPNPKRRQSKSRRNKRRTHCKAMLPQLTYCSTTGKTHLYHRAYWNNNKLYYRGKVVVELMLKTLVKK